VHAKLGPLAAQIKSLANTLYCIALLDAMFITFKLSTGIEYQSSGFQSALAESLSNNKEIFAEISGFFVPRPFGIFAFLLGLYVSHFLRVGLAKKL
jgi:hypothetical protein